jgi:hypothetical protein
MQRLHCSSHLHYGSMGYTGYDPSIWKLCGWSWQPGGANYRKVHPRALTVHSACNLNPNPNPNQERCAQP